jgi:SnoaL-like domain
MSQFRSISDRYEIEALRAAYTEALMGHRYSRVASLFTHDGVLWTSQSSASALERDQICSWLEQRQTLCVFFVQTSRSGGIEFDGDTAVGRA